MEHQKETGGGTHPLGPASVPSDSPDDDTATG